jgi:nucleotide-binding universal stress UspA family protein
MSHNLYIVPYDFSKTSEKALEYALFLAEKVKTEIQILHLSEDKPKGMAMRTKLEELKAGLTIPQGAEVSVLVRVGNIFTDIGKIAKKEKAQLVIMGTHGARGLQWLFGSHAMKVVTSADCPFLIVQKETELREIKEIIVPVDLTKESLQMVNIAGDMANIFNAKIHVLAESQSDPILNQRLQNRLSIVNKTYEEKGVDADNVLLKKGGSYGRKINNYIKTNKTDLIAFSYHTESLFPQFDTFAQKLITNKAKLPVMVINSKLASALYF